MCDSSVDERPTCITTTNVGSIRLTRWAPPSTSAQLAMTRGRRRLHPSLVIGAVSGEHGFRRLVRRCYGRPPHPTDAVSSCFLGSGLPVIKSGRVICSKRPVNQLMILKSIIPITIQMMPRPITPITKGERTRGAELSRARTSK